MTKRISIGIDGPAGSGKSTVAEIIAKRLNLYHLDTGAMYRTVGFHMLRCGVSHTDEKAVHEMLCKMEIDVLFDEQKKQHMILCGEDITGLIRTNEVSKAASDVATVGEVRERMVALQQEIARKHSVILDGRDVCTCVLPDADVKIFLTAAPEERARRRLLELQQKGKDEGKTLEEMTEEIRYRDKQDSERKISPLKVADGAHIIDSTYMTIEQVCEQIITFAGEV